MRKRMEKGWIGGTIGHQGRRGDATVCGCSSTLASTEAVRDWLPGLMVRHGILTVCDAGAGDLHWISRVCWDVDYKAFDLIPRAPGVVEVDVTTEALPPCDLILCRAVINHLCETRAVMALNQFRKSGRYLLATQFSDIPPVAVGFVRYDLRKPPFGLGEPLESIPDTCAAGCELSLWRL